MATSDSVTNYLLAASESFRVLTDLRQKVREAPHYVTDVSLIHMFRAGNHRRATDTSRRNVIEPIRPIRITPATRPRRSSR